MQGAYANPQNAGGYPPPNGDYGGRQIYETLSSCWTTKQAIHKTTEGSE